MDAIRQLGCSVVVSRRALAARLYMEGRLVLAGEGKLPPPLLYSWIYSVGDGPPVYNEMLLRNAQLSQLFAFERRLPVEVPEIPDRP